MRVVSSLLMILFVSGCATSGKMNSISIGMSKAEVIRRLGQPVSVSATSGTEYLNYRFSETSDNAFHGITTPYYVRIVDGKAESYGRTGDFDSTQPPTVKVQTEHTEVPARDASSTSAGLAKKLDELKTLQNKGVLNEQEYQSEKAALLRQWREKN